MVRRQILLKTNTWLEASQVGRTDRFLVVTMRVWASTLCTRCRRSGRWPERRDAGGARNEFAWRLALRFADRLS
jgi:hypothetical protein